jgi:hypothetical protein
VEIESSEKIERLVAVLDEAIALALGDSQVALEAQIKLESQIERALEVALAVVLNKSEYEQDVITSAK